MTLLENEFIKLRALEPEDLDILYKWENDSALWQYGSTMAPYSRFVLKEYLIDARQDIYHSRQLRLMIILKETETTIGTVDLYDFDPMNGRAGVGILIDSEYRQKGFGTETLNLIKRYAFDFLILKQLYAYVPEQNQASLNLFTSCGYKKTGHLYAWIKTAIDFEDVIFMQLINTKESF